MMDGSGPVGRRRSIPVTRIAGGPLRLLVCLIVWSYACMGVPETQAQLREAALLSATTVLAESSRGTGSQGISAEPGSTAPLRVAVREVPPFAMMGPDGRWTGLSIDLWEEIAGMLQVSYEYEVLPLRETLESLAANDIDVAPVALTITAARLQTIDFSHPYFISGLALAYPRSQESAWQGAIRRLFSRAFFNAVAALALVLLVAGAAVWLFERRANGAQFHHHPVRGLGDGLWWSAVTMTTVGYGDKAPQTLGGRIVALIWMFTSLIIIASFTASIAASLTAETISADRIRGRTLAELNIAALEGSSGAAFARNKGATVRTYETLGDAIDAVENGEIEAVLHDAPVLRYLSRTTETGITVAPRDLVRDDFGIGLAPDSPFRKAINESILEALRQENWDEIRRRYLGADSSG